MHQGLPTCLSVLRLLDARGGLLRPHTIRTGFRTDLSGTACDCSIGLYMRCVSFDYYRVLGWKGLRVYASANTSAFVRMRERLRDCALLRAHACSCEGSGKTWLPQS